MQPNGHFVSTGVAPERQAFGGHADPGVYLDSQAAFDADPFNFAQKARSWAPDTLYVINETCVANGNTYIRLTAGTSANIGTGPSGTGLAIADGAVANAWQFQSTGERIVGRSPFHTTHEGHPTGDDYSGNGGMIEIYAQTLHRMVTANRALANSPTYQGLQMGLSVAFGDGGEPCWDQKCIDLLRNVFGIDRDATPTDLSLWRAGKLLDRLKELDPDIDVECDDYIYDLQSGLATTGWTINPGLRLLLAQFQYRRESLPYEVFLERWSARALLDGFKIGAYDYFGLPGFVVSDPRFSLKSVELRFKAWINAGVDTLTTETTNSSGCVSPHFWHLSNLIWGSDESSDSALESWCNIAFGNASVPMERALDRWWAQEWPFYLPYDTQIGNLFDDLETADLLVLDDSGSRSRVAAFMAFATWLHLKRSWYELRIFSPVTWVTNRDWFDGDRCQNGSNEYKIVIPGRSSGSGPTGTGSSIVDGTAVWRYYSPAEYQTESEALAGMMIEFVWNNHHHRMIDTAWVIFMIFGAMDTTFQNAWNKINDPVWRADHDIHDYTDDEIRTDFEATRALYAPTPMTIDYISPTDIIAPNVRVGTNFIETNRVGAGEGPPEGHLYEIGVLPGQDSMLKIRYSGGAFSASTELISRIKVLSTTGDLIEQIDVPTLTTGEESIYELNLGELGVGYYRLIVQAATHSLFYQPQTPIVRVGNYYRALWMEGAFDRWFRVPPDRTDFHVFASADIPPVFQDSSGNIPTVTRLSKRLYRVTVIPGQANTTWKLHHNDQLGVYFLDISERTAPSENQLIIPEEYQ